MFDPKDQEQLDFNEELAVTMKAPQIKSAWTGIRWVLGVLGVKLDSNVWAHKQLRGMELA